LFPTRDQAKRETPVTIRRTRRHFKPRPRPSSLPPERLRYLATRVHALGVRPLAELFIELESGAEFADRVEAYARLDGDFIRALGGADLPVARVIRPARKRGAP
jgi:hypothetical protein